MTFFEVKTTRGQYATDLGNCYPWKGDKQLSDTTWEKTIYFQLKKDCKPMDERIITCMGSVFHKQNMGNAYYEKMINNSIDYNTIYVTAKKEPDGKLFVKINSVALSQFNRQWVSRAGEMDKSEAVQLEDDIKNQIKKELPEDLQTP
jgi:hypothetical protein